jgi:DNA-binding NarL/FixJ family response regulator
MPERAIRILLVDDHALFRQGLRQLLATTPDIVVVGEAGSASEAFELVPQLAPDVVLMDIAMPGLDGIAAALRQRFPTLRVVMLTMYEPTTSGEAARAAGAIAYVVKSSRPEELFAAIRAAANGAIPPNGEVRAGQSPPPQARILLIGSHSSSNVSPGWKPSSPNSAFVSHCHHPTLQQNRS